MLAHVDRHKKLQLRRLISIVSNTVLLGTTTLISSDYSAELAYRCALLQRAYPEQIRSASLEEVVWSDGTIMHLDHWDPDKSDEARLEHATLSDQLLQPLYIPGIPAGGDTYVPANDVGRVRYEPLFRKMYGDSAAEVAMNLETVPWMPLIFGNGTYSLQVTRVNGVADKIRAISAELEQLALIQPEIIPYVRAPAEGFHWRVIAHTTRLSAHSFGMTIDLDDRWCQYWQWDLQAAGIPVLESTPLQYRNIIPHAIVLVFEKYGFIWGGKWYHYDTQHFEYRPELFPQA